MNWSAGVTALNPFGVVTVTSTVPAAPAGAVAETEVAEVTLKMAGTEPKSTAVAPLKPVPVMVTPVPPSLDPDVGLTEITAGPGPGVTKVNSSALVVALTAMGVMTVTSLVPAPAGGDTAEMAVSELTVNDVAATEPKSTAVAPVKPLPVTVTEVPPVVSPASGLTAVTEGGEDAVADPERAGEDRNETVRVAAPAPELAPQKYRPAAATVA